MSLAPAQQSVAAKAASRDLTDLLLAASVVFVSAMPAVANVVAVIKQVHIIVQIVEERAQPWTAAQSSAESAASAA